MTELTTRAQLELLATTLRVPVERVAHLRRLGADDLHELREKVSNAIFDDNAETFRRIGALIPIVPLQIAMPLVQRLVPAPMAGRAGGAVGLAHPNKAVQALTMLSAEYAAEAAPYLDPRAVEHLAHLAPPEPIVRIANEILRRRDYPTAGLFVDFATPELVRAVEAGVHDDEGLLYAGAYVRSGRTLSYILREIMNSAPGRLARLVGAAVRGSTTLRLAALSVLSRLEDELITHVGAVLFEETDDELLADVLRTFLAEGAAAELLRFAARLNSPELDRLAANPALTEDAALRTLVGAPTHPACWSGLLAILEHADEPTARRSGTLLAELGLVDRLAPVDVLVGS